MKTNKRKFKLISMVLILGLFMTACASKPDNPSNDGDPLAVTFGTAVQPDMPTGIMAQWATDEINNKSNGAIKVSCQQNGVLGSDADLAQQVLDGQIPLACISLSAFSQYTSAFEAIQLPFLLDTLEKEGKAVQSAEFKELVKGFEEQFDVKVLGIAENGLRHFATVDKPVKSLADLKGLKIRVAPSVITQEAFKKMGANPVSIAYYEVTTALQNGTIDGEEINITSVGSQKHYDVVKYVTEIGMYPFPSLYVMNGKYYDSLSDEQKKLFEDTFTEGQELAFSKFTAEQDAKFKEESIANGVEFFEITEKKEFIDSVKSLYDVYSEKDPKIKAFIDMANNL